MTLTLNDYQNAAKETAVYPHEVGLSYTALGLAGEAGEVANKVKKVYRDNGGKLNLGSRKAIRDELGDTLWYLAQLATELGVSLEEVAAENLTKLKFRKQYNTLKGNGDNR